MSKRYPGPKKDLDKVKMRTCLKCDKVFRSEGPWNRNCGCLRDDSYSVKRTFRIHKKDGD